jgi:hypothetical protein
MVFGTLEGLKNISSVDFLGLFDLDKHEDEGELQKFEYSVDDIRKSPTVNTFSNKGYINPNDIKTGDIFLEASTDSFITPPEPPESKSYRNAQDDEQQ